MKFSEATLTKNKKGRVEVRALDSHGEYVLCKYLDPNTMKLSDKKKALFLKGEDGKVQEYFIIPLNPNRSLLIKGEKGEKERKVWSEKTKKEESLFK